MNSSECLSAESMTAMIGGKASRRERARWISHLDDCPDCRTVLSGAASYIDEISAGEERAGVRERFHRVLHPPVLAWGSALALVATVVIAALLDPMDWFRFGDRPTMSFLSVSESTALLFDAGDADYTAYRWTSTDRALGFSPALGSRERAFRTGVYLVDVNVAVREDGQDEARRVLDELERLLGESGVTAPLRRALETGGANDTVAGAVGDVETRARRALGDTFVSLGIWAESARLAAAANARDYFFLDRRFHDGLAAFRELELEPPVATRLAAIDTIVAADLDETELPRLERELRQLILLH